MAIFRYSGNWRSYLEGSSSTVSQNIAGNSSVIKVDVWIGMDAGWSIEFGNTYGNTVTVTCDGQSQTLAVGPLYLNGSKKHLGSVQFTVSHSADGTKTAGISLSSNMSNINYANLSFGNASGSWNHGLATIPRSSSISFGTGTIGSPLAITINRASSSFTHTLRWAWGNRSGTIASGLTTSASWTIPMDFCNEIPNNVSGNGTIFVDTYSGSTNIGTQSKQFTANVPDSIIPTLSSISVVEEHATANGLNLGATTFIQIISNIKATINGAAGTYGSTIKSTLIEIEGKGISSSSNPASFTDLNFNGAVKLKATVTDSRGRKSAVKELSINLLEYFAPALSIHAYRTREYPDKIQVLRTLKIAPLSVGGVQRNKAVLKFRAASLNSSTFVDDAGTADATWTTQSSLTNSPANLSKTYATNKSWVVEGVLSDIFTSSLPSIAKSTVSTETAIHAYDKDGRFGVGKIPELGPAGSLDVAGNIYADGKQIQQHQLTSNEGRSPYNASGTVDLNTKTKNEFFSCNEPTNGPTIGSGPGYNAFFIAVYSESDNYLSQNAIQKNSGRMFTRAREAGNWTPWIEYATTNHPNLINTGWISTGTIGVHYKRQGDVVALRLQLNTTANQAYGLGRIPVELLPIPNSGTMMRVTAWTADQRIGRNLQINGDGTMVLPPSDRGDTINTQVTWII